MKAIIPVAGFGTRLRPHTLTHPKVLLPVADRPMIAHIVDKLIGDGVAELVFVVGHLGSEIEKYIRANYSVTCHFIEQKEFLGLGHAIYTAGDFLNEEPLIIVLGDTIYDVDLLPVLNSTHSTLGVKKVEDPRRFGVAVLDEQNFISRLVEKPQEFLSDLALVGLYYFTSGTPLKNALEEIIRKNIRTKNEYQLTDALQVMIDAGEKLTVFNVDGWFDCGKAETLIETNGILLQRDFPDSEYDFTASKIVPPVFIHPGAKITRAVIGPNVTVGKDAQIRNAVISHSIIGPEAVIENTVLEQSLIGDHTRIIGKSDSLSTGDYSTIG